MQIKYGKSYAKVKNFVKISSNQSPYAIINTKKRAAEVLAENVHRMDKPILHPKRDEPGLTSWAGDGCKTCSGVCICYNFPIFKSSKS